MSEAVPLLVIFTILVAAVLIWSVQAQKRLNARLSALAGRTGLMFLPGKGLTGETRVSGTVRGKHVQFFTYATGSGKSRRTWAVLSVAPSRAAAGFTFSFRRQGFGTKLRTLFGAKELTVGDRAFDECWFIQSSQPDFLRAALIPELRQKLNVAAESGVRGAFLFEGGAVRYEEQGTFHDGKRCDRYEALLPLVCDLADVVEVGADVTGK